MFARPRPRKPTILPPTKRRKTNPSIDEINFDFNARSEYLTGFHKRKVLRSKKAIEEAKVKEREEKVLMRKQLREERKQELEAHVDAVNALLEEAKNIPGLSSSNKNTSLDDSSDSDNEWQGFNDSAIRERLDHEEEYIDEDRFTTVTVEEVDVTKDGLRKTVAREEEDDEMAEEGDKGKGRGEGEKGKKVWPKKVKKKKFRYETKTERKMARAKQASGNRAKASARRGDD